MKLNNLPERIKLQLIRVLSHEPSVSRAMLFGSRARGDAREGSDIDIALFGNNIPLFINTRLRDSAGLYKLDIVHYHHCDNELLKQNILQDGIEIYRKST